MADPGEDLAVDERPARGGTVRIETMTQLRDRRVDMPLMHERIDIVHVPIGHYVDTIPDIRQEGDLTIMPVIEEVLVVERRLLLKEEVHIRRVDEIEQHVETVVLHVQEARITHLPPVAVDASSTSGSKEIE